MALPNSPTNPTGAVAARAAQHRRRARRRRAAAASERSWLRSTPKTAAQAPPPGPDIEVVVQVESKPPTQVAVSIPRELPIAEVIEDILVLAGAPAAPQNSDGALLPWQLRSASGEIFDIATPAGCELFSPGELLVLGPAREIAAPAVQDAAEALSARNTTPATNGMSTIAASAGLLIMLCGLYTLAPHFPLWGAAAAVGIWALGLFTRLRLHAPERPDLAASCLSLVLLWLCPLLVTTTLVSPSSPASAAAWLPWLLLSWAGAGSAICLATVALIFPLLRSAIATHKGRISPCDNWCSGVLCTVVTLLWLTFAAGWGALGWWTQRSFAGAGAAAALWVLITYLLAPRLSVMCCSASLPQLPLAGQELKECAPGALRISALTAQWAQACYRGMLFGCVPISAAAAAALSQQPGALGAWGLLTLGISALIHASRHADRSCMWALWLSGWVLVAGAVWLGSQAAQPIVLQVLFWAFPVVMAVAGLSCPLWNPQLIKFSPPVLGAIEKLETLCLSGALPLLVAACGVYARIRGWAA